MVHEPPHIALLLGITAIDREIAAGVRRYLAGHHLHWQLTLVEPRSVSSQRSTTRMQEAYDGALGFFKGPESWAWARTQGMPVVHYGGGTPTAERWAQLIADDASIGHLAARYLVDRGFRSFACVGHRRIDVRRHRHAAFMAGLARLGHPCAEYDYDRRPENAGRAALADMLAWLASLPRPVALFCHQDRPAALLMEHVADAGLRIPDDVAALGVDNCVELCEMCEPQLTSIQVPWRHLGERGARYLHRMLHGEPLALREQVPVVHVVERASTRPPRCDDDLAARCRALVGERYGGPCPVDGLARDLGVDRSTLLRHVRRALGCSVSELVHRARIEAATGLLLSTDRPATAIGQTVGYANHHRFWAMFRRRTGLSPSAFRRRAR